MASGVFDLRTIAAGVAEPVGGNRLTVDAQSVATVKKGLVGSTVRAVRERATVRQIREGRAEELVDLDGLSVEAQRLVSAASTNRPNDPFLVIAFDDGAFDDVYWVLQGDAVDVGSAAAALRDPVGGGIDASPRVAITPRPTSHRRGILIITLGAVAFAGVVAALVFALVPQTDDGSDADTPAAQESEAAGDAVDANEEGAPAEAEDAVEPAPDAAQSDAGPYEPGGLAAIASQLQDELGYVPRFTRIIASDEFVIFSVRLPGNGTDVDTWAWRDGEISGPDPEQVPVPEQVAEMSFTRNDVRLAALPSLARRAEAIPIEDNEVSTTVIQRLILFDPGVVFLVNAGGPRESAQLRADAQGEVTEII